MTTHGSKFIKMKNAIGETFRFCAVVLLKPDKDESASGISRSERVRPGDTFRVTGAHTPTGPFICELTRSPGFRFRASSISEYIAVGCIEHLPWGIGPESKHTHQLACNHCKKFSLLGGFCKDNRPACSEECYDPA